MTTKQKEREILAKIDELITSAGPGSYISMAFSGCVEMAASNITNDFGNSFPDAIEYRDQRIAEQEKEIRRLSKSIEEFRRDDAGMRDAMNSMRAEKDGIMLNYDRLSDEAHRIGDKLADAERKIAEQDNEIIRLKAKLYDLTIGKE